MQEPQTRITPPLRRTPPGQQRGQPPGSSREQIRFSVSMSSQPVSTPQTTTPVPGISPDQTILERLPDPHLTRSSLAVSPNAHHDGLQPTQLRGGLAPTPAGPTPEGQQSSISRIAPLFRNRFLHRPPFAFVTHRPPGSQHEEITRMHGFFDPAGSADGSRKRRRRCCLPHCKTASAPQTRRFRGSIARPARTPTDASPPPSRTDNARLGAIVDR
jgi:hypothetical protein